MGTRESECWAVSILLAFYFFCINVVIRRESGLLYIGQQFYQSLYFLVSSFAMINGGRKKDLKSFYLFSTNSLSISIHSFFVLILSLLIVVNMHYRCLQYAFLCFYFLISFLTLLLPIFLRSKNDVFFFVYF